MGNQIDATREYTSVDESESPQLRNCPNCRVNAVPRGISSSHKAGVVEGEVHCPNCGHVYGRDNH
jgi:transcription elongation factor Elf1